MAATNAALASGGITHCSFRCGLRTFFLASGRSCYRWHGQRCSAPRPCLPAASVHFARPRGGAEQAKAISLASVAPSKIRGLAEAADACASAPLRSPLPPIVGASGTPSRGWFPAPHDLAVAPSFTALDVSAFNRIRAFIKSCAECLPCGSIHADAVVRRLSVSRRTFLRLSLWQPRIASGNWTPGDGLTNQTHNQ